MTIEIEKERLDFLVYAYFGSEEDPFIACSRRAYLDLCRTIRFEGQSGESIRTEVDLILRGEISSLLANKNMTQDYYDEWHRSLCHRITACYKPYGIDFSVGQAQKWLNMTIKYLYIRGSIGLTHILNYCHIPLDKYVFNIAKQLLKIKFPKKRWSRIANYCEYMEYQNKLRNAICNEGKVPFIWELENWLIEAKKSGRNGL